MAIEIPWGEIEVSDAHVHFFSYKFFRLVWEICLGKCPRSLREAGRKVKSGNWARGELRDEDKFAQFEASIKNFLTELRYVVFVSVPDFLDEAVQTQTFEKPWDLATVFLWQITPKG